MPHPPLPLGRQSGCSGEKALDHAGNQTLGHPAHSLATILTTLAWLLLTCMGEMENMRKIVTVNSKEAFVQLR